MSSSLPLVNVICATYNQEKYIGQCLEGILMQETDFEFEVIVNDDASTDRTPEIVKEYEMKHDNIVAIYQERNLWSQGISIPRTILYPRVRGKYVAICEGDDYWIDPLKLQKQVEYMEAHPEVSVCATEGYVLNQTSGKMTPVYDSKKVLFTLEDLLRSNPISTVSTLSRAEWLMEYQMKIAPLLPHFLMGDYPLWFYMAKRGPIALLKDKCFVYRELEQSASHFKSPYKHIDFYISVCDIRACFNSLLKIGRPFMIYRKFRNVRRECRRVAKAYGVGFWKLYFYSLKKMIFHSAARPSKEARAAVSEILK